MINVKKGTAHSLTQSDFVGTAKADEGIVAGMLVIKDASGDIVKAGAAADDDLTEPVNASRYGFAINNQTDGDVIFSGKIGAYGLDGNSVIETDAFDPEDEFVIGDPVIPAATATGLVRPYVANGKIIGTYEGTRTLRGTALIAIKLSA